MPPRPETDYIVTEDALTAHSLHHSPHILFRVQNAHIIEFILYLRGKDSFPQIELIPDIALAIRNGALKSNLFPFDMLFC